MVWEKGGHTEGQSSTQGSRSTQARKGATNSLNDDRRSDTVFANLLSKLYYKHIVSCLLEVLGFFCKYKSKIQNITPWTIGWVNLRTPSHLKTTYERTKSGRIGMNGSGHWPSKAASIMEGETTRKTCLLQGDSRHLWRGPGEKRTCTGPIRALDSGTFKVNRGNTGTGKDIWRIKQNLEHRKLYSQMSSFYRN